MRKQIAIAFSICLMLLALAVTAVAQEPSSFVAEGNGKGTIKIGKEEFKLHAVVVKLFEDGKAEIHLITDITVFIHGFWARNSDPSKGIDLQIAGAVKSNNMDGGGKLFLREDNKSVIDLKLEVFNKLTKKVIKVDFIAK